MLTVNKIVCNILFAWHHTSITVLIIIIVFTPAYDNRRNLQLDERKCHEIVTVHPRCRVHFCCYCKIVRATSFSVVVLVAWWTHARYYQIRCVNVVRFEHFGVFSCCLFVWLWKWVMGVKSEHFWWHAVVASMFLNDHFWWVINGCGVCWRQRKLNSNNCCDCAYSGCNHIFFVYACFFSRFLSVFPIISFSCAVSANKSSFEVVLLIIQRFCYYNWNSDKIKTTFLNILLKIS